MKLTHKDPEYEEYNYEEEEILKIIPVITSLPTENYPGPISPTNNFHQRGCKVSQCKNQFEKNSKKFVNSGFFRVELFEFSEKVQNQTRLKNYIKTKKK